MDVYIQTNHFKVGMINSHKLFICPFDELIFQLVNCINRKTSDRINMFGLVFLSRSLSVNYPKICSFCPRTDLFLLFFQIDQMSSFQSLMINICRLLIITQTAAGVLSNFILPEYGKTHS